MDEFVKAKHHQSVMMEEKHAATLFLNRAFWLIRYHLKAIDVVLTVAGAIVSEMLLILDAAKKFYPIQTEKFVISALFLLTLVHVKLYFQAGSLILIQASVKSLVMEDATGMSTGLKARVIVSRCVLVALAAMKVQFHVARVVKLHVAQKESGHAQMMVDITCVKVIVSKSLRRVQSVEKKNQP